MSASFSLPFFLKKKLKEEKKTKTCFTIKRIA
jgi:hypothetical protein